MSALRYSGELRIRVTYVEPTCGHLDEFPNGQYRCVIVCTAIDNPCKCIIWVGTPRYLDRAVDSAEAFDDAAEAALAFAESDGWPIDVHAAYTDDGLYIGRSKTKAWPVEGASDKRETG